MGIKVRNEKIDIVRGIAILMVVACHVVAPFIGGEDTIIYNIAFSVLMPLFMLVSGYSNIFSKPVNNVKAFFQRLLRRSTSLLLPWLVWTIIRYLLFGASQSFFKYFVYVLIQPDASYWFLITLWTIDLIVSLSSLLSCIGKQKYLDKLVKIILHLLYIGVFFIGLAILGKIVGMNTFAIKYSLYYMPFYCLGYLFGVLYDDITKIKHYDMLLTILFAICSIAYVAFCLKFNVAKMSDSLTNIILRFIMSLSGCIAILIFLNKINTNFTFFKGIKYLGVHSLEIYLIHNFFVSIIIGEGIVINTLNGTLTCILNYIFCIALCVFVIVIVDSNFILRRMLFGKK